MSSFITQLQLVKHAGRASPTHSSRDQRACLWFDLDHGWGGTPARVRADAAVPRQCLGGLFWHVTLRPAFQFRQPPRRRNELPASTFAPPWPATAR